MDFNRRDLGAHLLPILLSQCVGLGFGVLSVRLSSYWVAPADYGAYGLFVNFAPLGMTVVMAGTLKFVAREWPGKRTALRPLIIRSFWQRAPWVIAAAALGAFALPIPWQAAFPALAVSALAMSMQGLVQTALQAERRNWQDLGVGLVTSTLRTLLPLALYVGVAAKSWVLVGGFAVHALVAAGATWLIGGWHQRPDGAATGNANCNDFEGPRFVLLALIGWMMGLSGRSIVMFFFGAEEAGYFTLAGNVAIVVVAVLFTLVQQYFQPRLFAVTDTESPNVKKLIRLTDLAAVAFAIAGIGGLVVLSLLMPHLIGSLVAPQYAAAVHWVLPAGCYHLAILGSTFPHLLLLAVRRERACGPPEITSAVVLLFGAIAAAAWSAEAFRWFALGSPVIPWLTTRPLARKALGREVTA